MKNERILLPLIAYILFGLLIIRQGALAVEVADFLVWAVMAGCFYAVRRYVSNRMVNWGTTVYVIGMIVWLVFWKKEDGFRQTILFILSLVLILLLMVLMRWRIIRIAAGVLGLGSMILLTFRDVDFPRGMVVLALILFLNAISELIALFYPSDGKSLLIIYILIALVTVFTPASRQPYGWDFVVEIVEGLENVWNRIAVEIHYKMMSAGQDGLFHFHTSGYSEFGSDLNHGVRQNDLEQLIVSGNRTRRDVYLKGNVSAVFDKTRWHREELFDVPDYRIDTLMTLYAIFSHTDDIRELQKFMAVKRQEVTLQNIKTQSLFYPVKLLSISAPHMEASGDLLRSEEVNGRGYTYSYQFVDLDYSSEFLSALLKEEGKREYEEDTYYHIYEVLRDYYHLELEPIAFEDFVVMAEDYEKKVRQAYCTGADSLSERSQVLAKQITDGCRTDYERCRTLEKFLYQYHYNCDVKFPGSSDVIDYFLFEGKEGYCMHYATALTMMLQHHQIPARFVEGFLVDYKKNINNYTYSVESNKAHAWVEAYIDGFGWIRLEPTVVNAFIANAVWYVEEDEQKEGEEKPVLAIPEDFTDTQQQQEKSTPWKLSLWFMGGFLLMVAVILVAGYVYRGFVIRNSTNPEVVCNQLLQSLEKKCGKRTESETLFEYFERIKGMEELPKECKTELPQIMKNMEDYWYANKNIQGADIDKMKQFCRNV